MTKTKDEQLVDLAMKAEPFIDQFETQVMDLADKMQDYAIAEDGITVKEIDEAYRALKATSRELNKLGKQKRSLLLEES